jgi:hypothetical protein
MVLINWSRQNIWLKLNLQLLRLNSYSRWVQIK